MTVLAIRCELLTGVYHAADPFGPPQRPEWPPHPFRLHAALVATACELGGETPRIEHVEALEWLERQGAPGIAHSPAVSRSAPLAYVPRNPVQVEFTRARDKERKTGQFVNPWQRNGRRFPAAVPRVPTLTYRWEIAEQPPAALEELVHGVSWLGSARSPVGCALIDNAAEATLLPATRGISLRIAAPGVTHALLAARHVWPTPVDPLVVTYAAPEGTTDAVPADVFGTLLIRRLEGPRLDLRYAGHACAGLRAAVLSHAGDDAPDALHGHGDTAHAAYLALGDVGRSHASGVIAGLALALPVSADAATVAAASDALARVHVITLGSGMRPLRLATEPGTTAALRPERWCGPARLFATTTPVILDRFPRRALTVEESLRHSLANAGFPTPSSVEVLAGPAVRGGVLVGDLTGDLPPGKRVHARVGFDRPVRGPLVAGRGRFRGIGLFVPLHVDT